MSPETPLSNQVALVTGAGRGIGKSISSHLASLGAKVALCARSQNDLEALSRDITSKGGTATALACDVSDLRSVERVCAEVEKSFGRLDILVNNAGVGSFSGPLHEMTPEDWEKVLNTNLRGVFYCIRAFAPMMIRQGGGHIVNISSLAGKNPLPNGAAYAASKWGLNGLSYAVAEELRAKNVRVSVVCPGSVDTSEGWHHGKNSNKMLQPDDIADCAWLVATLPSRAVVEEISLSTR